MYLCYLPVNARSWIVLMEGFVQSVPSLWEDGSFFPMRSQLKMDPSSRWPMEHPMSYQQTLPWSCARDQLGTLAPDSVLVNGRGPIDVG